MYVAMSTLTGQSVLQPLQARHRSRASRTAVERQPSVTGESAWPPSISNSSRARPRVECSSSPGGPVGGAHHAAALVAAAVADADAAQRPPAEAAVVLGVAEAGVRVVAGRPGRRRAAGRRRAGAGRTTLPGFIRSPGSKSALTSPKARDQSGRRTSWAAARPGPGRRRARRTASRRRTTTRSAAAQERPELRRRPSAVRRSNGIRVCTQPWPKWP